MIRVFLLLLTAAFFGCSGVNGQSAIDLVPENLFPGKTPLPVPQVLKYTTGAGGIKKFNLVVQSGVTRFFPGAEVITFGYNGNILGPVIRASKGDTVSISVKNRLREYTTVHWHGLLVPGNKDGGPHQVIPPDGEWTARFKIDQPAATAWYHPHGLGTTAYQVYRGLAGLFIIDDRESTSLGLPSDYGVNDIPLIVQDKRFTSDGYPVYLSGMRDIMEGMKGDTVLVNGAVGPVFETVPALCRFRILNGSNARLFRFRLSDGREFYQVATDCGLLEKPVKMKELRLSPGERGEILVDFSGNRNNDILYIKSEHFTVLKIVIKGNAGKQPVIPSTLVKTDLIPLDSVVKNRRFVLEGMGHHVAINGKQMNMRRVDERMKFGTSEVWHITSSTRGMMGMMGGPGGVYHNFHAHGVHFLIIDRNGYPVSDGESGWKDTVYLDNNETVTVITRFLHKGVFMYHCHILEHEDNGMMGQFSVQ